MDPEHIALLHKLYSRLDDMINVCQDDDFRINLTKHKEDLAYTAPEIIGLWGQKIENMFIRRFGDTPPTEGWEKQTLDAWVLPRP